MSVAALERFADPSRRCEPGHIADRVTDVQIWNLPGFRNQPLDLARSVPGAVADWLTGDIPPGDRRKLLRACLCTGGARLGALARAPDLYRRARAGEVDRLACFSSKSFGLAGALAEATRAPADEVISRGTQYFGEFAFELLAVLPYAYWLHRNGQLDFTASTSDTRCLYYFSPRHEERPGPRRYVPISEYPVGRPGSVRYDRKAFPARFDSRRWLPPPYREVYRNDRFRFGRELCVVANKTSSERYLRRGFAVNSIGTDLLLAVIGRLGSRYQVVYSRPRASDIVNDHQSVREAGDIAAVKRTYPDVVTIQELATDNPDLSFNELQLNLLASCGRFVSVLGGGSYLASYFGGTNVVYARRGWEVSCAAFENWFDRFSGARVVAASTPAELLRAVERELL